MKTMERPKPASARSIEYLTDIVRDRDVDPGLTAGDSLKALTKWLAAGRSQADVSSMIERNRSKPRRLLVPALTSASSPASPAVFTSYPSVPDAVPNSKFAILTELLVNAPDAWRKQEYLFFEVKQVRGRRTSRRLVGAPGAFNRTPLPAALASELYLHLTKENVAFVAAETFGKIYQCCGRCAAELTDDTSRERQFGPVCWELMYGLKGI